MNLPIRFPKDEDVIAEDAARFRALSDDDRLQALGDSFREYEFLLRVSGRPEHLLRLADEEDRLSHVAIREFVARHG